MYKSPKGDWTWREPALPWGKIEGLGALPQVFLPILYLNVWNFYPEGHAFWLGHQFQRFPVKYECVALGENMIIHLCSGRELAIL